MLLRQIFDPYLAQYAYLIGCQRSGEALVIDPERDIDQYRDLAAANGLTITAVAETHIHADFVSGAQEFAADPAVQLYLSAAGGPDWSYRWPRGRPNTHLVSHGDVFTVGRIELQVVHTPGHTPEHICFIITDRGGRADAPLALAAGDFLFVGDVGRPDLLETAAGVRDVMEPSARILQHSLVTKLAALPDFVQVLPGHGAGSACGKALGAVPISTLGYERRFNRALQLALASADDFVRDILHGQPNPPLYFGRMKQVNRDGLPVTGGVPRGQHLTGGALSEAIQAPDTRVLDLRMDVGAFGAGHIAGAISAPLRSNFFAMAAGSFLTGAERIVIVVERAEDVDLASRQLYRIGLDTIHGWLTVEEAASTGLLSTPSERIQFSSFDPEVARRRGEILDVRSTAEFEVEHLEGARSVPWTRLREHLAELPRERTLFVHCASGRRAALAASLLRSEGLSVVHVDGPLASFGQS